MEVELLHIHHGDKKKVIDTASPEGKNEVERLFKNLCEQKCAVFLERGKKSYRVVGYDKEADQLIVENPKRPGKRAKNALIGDRMKLSEAERAFCRVEASAAKVAAVAPVAGGSSTASKVVFTWLAITVTLALWWAALYLTGVNPK